MLFLLRKIRQKLLSENKISTYLPYAIGEIFLVVIGILIAVSIDDWNQSRIDAATEQYYYQRILGDLRSDEAKIAVLISDAASRVERSKQLLLKLDQGNQDQGYLIDEYILCIRGNVFIPVKSTINEVASSGNTYTLKNEDLKTALFQYYSELDNITGILSYNAEYKFKIGFDYNNLFQTGYQNSTLNRQLVGEEIHRTLPQNNWHEKPDDARYVKFQSDLLMIMSLSYREIELLQLILDKMYPIIEQLEKVKNS